MTVDSLEHDGTIGDDCVEIGGGREALVGPKFLVPSAADDPARIRMRGGVSTEPMFQIVERAGADEVELESTEAEASIM